VRVVPKTRALSVAWAKSGLGRESTMTIRAQQRSGTLVGRVGELAELDRGLERVGLGKPWFVRLVGEPGIGKTRLLAQLGIRAEQRGWLVLDGRAAEFERDVPFGVIVDAARQAAQPRWRGSPNPIQPSPA
jgi:hypothetical protein